MNITIVILTEHIFTIHSLNWDFYAIKYFQYIQYFVLSPLQLECDLIDYHLRVWSNNDKRHLIYFLFYKFYYPLCTLPIKLSITN